MYVCMRRYDTYVHTYIHTYHTYMHTDMQTCIRTEYVHDTLYNILYVYRILYFILSVRCIQRDSIDPTALLGSTESEFRPCSIHIATFWGNVWFWD